MKRDWLINYRKKKELTQEQVASMVFIDRGYYSHIETGKRNPSFHIAINIAKVLNFKPELFFDGFPSSLKVKNRARDIFESMDKGDILYVYDELESQLQHLFLFITTGVERGSNCYIIGDYEDIKTIKQQLSLSVCKELTEHVVLVNTEDIVFDDIKNEISDDDSKSIGQRPIRIWFMSNESSRKEHMADSLLNLEEMTSHNNVLFIYSLNAHLISAGFHIHLMKKYKYLMTDIEVVESPFYQSNDESRIFPSLYKQSNLKK